MPAISPESQRATPMLMSAFARTSSRPSCSAIAIASRPNRIASSLSPASIMCRDALATTYALTGVGSLFATSPRARSRCSIADPCSPRYHSSSARTVSASAADSESPTASSASLARRSVSVSHLTAEELRPSDFELESSRDPATPLPPPPVPTGRSPARRICVEREGPLASVAQARQRVRERGIDGWPAARRARSRSGSGGRASRRGPRPAQRTDPLRGQAVLLARWPRGICP